MSESQPVLSLGELEQRVERRVAQFERMLGVLSHSLGATMFPSLPSQEEVKDHRQWRRVVFATEALVDHVRNERAALDFARNPVNSELESMPKSQWSGRVWPTLEAVVEGSQCVKLEVDGDGSISPSFTREVLTLLLAVDEMASTKSSMNVRIDIAANSVELVLPSGLAGLRGPLDSWLGRQRPANDTQTKVRFEP